MSAAELDPPQLKVLTGGKSDPRARFELRYQEHAKGVLELARSVLRSDHEAAFDVVQETFARFWESYPEDRPENAVRPWLLRVAYNLCANHLRDQRSEPLGEGDEDVADHRTGVQEDVMDGESQRLLREVADRLPEKQRTVLQLKIDEGMTYEQIAEIMGCSEISAKRYMKLATDRVTEQARRWGVIE